LKTLSLATAAARAAVCARILFAVLLLGASGAALATTDAERITQVMKAGFDRPGQPLSVDPVSVEGPFAIAGWSQGGSGGRALLQRMGTQWQIVLCAGDALLQPATLTGAGMAPDAATRLVANQRTAESRLPAARREQFARFMGVVKVAGGADLSVSNAWGRATPAGVAVGAAYFTVVNHGKQSDTLVAVTSPVAATAELHRTSVEGSLARMRPAGQVVITPGQTVKAEPGGLHLMLTGLRKPLVAGSQVPLVLHFRQAGAITVQMDVQPATSAAPDAYAGH
jgi:copper(I)-binding protein